MLSKRTLSNTEDRWKHETWKQGIITQTEIRNYDQIFFGNAPGGVWTRNGTSWLMYVACCCSWGPGVCCHMLPSFHSHERSLLAKPRISNLRVHVKSDDMCAQLVSALSYIIIILIGRRMSNSSMEYPWYPESIQRTLMDLVTFKNVQKHSKTIFGCSSKLSTSS